jgi:phospholipase C
VDISRRKLLAGATAATVLAPLAAERTAAAVPSAAALPAPGDSGIDHIIVVMMENRSFDHYMGWLQGADGKQDGLTFIDRNGTAHSTHHLTDPQGCGNPDPDHSFTGGRVQFDDGRCDGFLRSGNNDAYAIGYYLPKDLDFYRPATAAWTVADRYFAAFMGPTFPNRFYQHAAQTDRTSNTTTIATMPTIWDRLADAGLTGHYYFIDSPFTALWGTKYTDISLPYATFLGDCAAGTLPQVSFVDPKFLGEGTGTSADDHPHADIRVGQAFLNEIYHAVTTGPAWSKTLLVINYDEWGGFFDHVPPSVAPDVNPDFGLRGFRVANLIVSPRARRGFVAHNVYDHTSVLKAIEWRWDLPPLTPRDAAANNIAEVLDFAKKPNLDAPRFSVPEVVPVACPEDMLDADFAEWTAVRDLALAHGWKLP